jgi:ABC-2 type transport system permease protein
MNYYNNALIKKISRVLSLFPVFIKKDFLTAISYKMSFVLGLLSGLIGVIQFGFLGWFLGKGNSSYLLQQYGNDPISFLIIGNIFASFISISLNSFQNSIRSEQYMGTLEHLLLTNISLGELVLFSSIWSYVTILGNSILLFIVAHLLFNISLSINYTSVVIVIIFTLLSTLGLGMISAGIIMVTKQGDPIGWIYSILTSILSGVIYPVEILPDWLQRASYILPTTHALHALRLCLLAGVPIRLIASDLIFLAIFSIISMPIGIIIYNKGLIKAKKLGSLTQY